MGSPKSYPIIKVKYMHNLFSKTIASIFILSASFLLAGQSFGQPKKPRTLTRELERPTSEPAKTDAAPEKTSTPTLPAPNKPKKVMIVDFDARGITRWWSGNWDIGSLFANSTIGPLSRTNGYEVVERDRMLELFKEQGLSESERFNQNSVTKIGRLLGADYILFGYLTDFTRKTSNKWLYKETSARISFSVRLVDVATGKVVNSTEEDFLSKPKKDIMQNDKINPNDPEFLQTLFGNAITESTKEAVGKLTGSMNSTPSPGQVNTPGFKPNTETANAGMRGKVADVTGNTITINRGRQHAVREGQFFAVLKIIKEIKDPDTGNVIKLQTEEQARLKINTVSDASSEGVLVSGNINSLTVGTEVVLVDGKKP